MVDTWYKPFLASLKACHRCRLCESATQVVPGDGSLTPVLLFIGEAPGYYEDKEGKPFVGRAGQLLNQLLTKIGLDRSQVYITNIIKHRPPENRDPLPDEIAACRDYLSLQLEMIKPKIIITLGRFSYNYFFPSGKISRDHGTILMYRDSVVFPLYHPAAALRNPEILKQLTEDFLKIPQILRDKDTKQNKIDEDDLQLQLI